MHQHWPRPPPDQKQTHTHTHIARQKQLDVKEMPIESGVWTFCHSIITWRFDRRQLSSLLETAPCWHHTIMSELSAWIVLNRVRGISSSFKKWTCALPQLSMIDVQMSPRQVGALETINPSERSDQADLPLPFSVVDVCRRDEPFSFDFVVNLDIIPQSAWVIRVLYVRAVIVIRRSEFSAVQSFSIARRWHVCWTFSPVGLVVC